MRHLVHELSPDQVILFGSRARGTHRENSDSDNACRFTSRNDLAWTTFQLELKESPWTLWNIELVDYSDLTKDYQSNIDQEGVLLYA